MQCYQPTALLKSIQATHCCVTLCMVRTQLLVQIQWSSLGALRVPKSRRSSGAERRNSLPLQKAELMLFNTPSITYTHTIPLLICGMFWVTQDYRPELWLMALFPNSTVLSCASLPDLLSKIWLSWVVDSFRLVLASSMWEEDMTTADVTRMTTSYHI